MIYLYDPRTNITTPTSYKELSEWTGRSESTLRNSKLKGRKVKSINAYITDGNTGITQRRKWYEKETFPDEHWKPIQGSNEEYAVSNYGRIKRMFKHKDKVLLPFRKKQEGNLLTKVRHNGRYGEYKIAYLVAKHYIGKQPEGSIVIHKNGIITDDFAGNLEYISRQELGKRTAYKAKSKPVTKFCLDTGEILDEYRSAREAGRENYLSYQAVLDNCNHKSKSSGGYLFRFTEEIEEERVSV